MFWEHAVQREGPHAKSMHHVRWCLYPLFTRDFSIISRRYAKRHLVAMGEHIQHICEPSERVVFDRPSRPETDVEDFDILSRRDSLLDHIDRLIQVHI